MFDLLPQEILSWSLLVLVNILAEIGFLISLPDSVETGLSGMVHHRLDVIE